MSSPTSSCRPPTCVRCRRLSWCSTRRSLDLPVHLDERLRERELGILDLLTRHGVEARYPDEARRKERLGKFYHRPPGGESWVDVALRIRSLRDSLGREHLDKRVLMVCHEVVVVIWRYLIEDLDEQAALALSRDHPLANCALTTYVTGTDRPADARARRVDGSPRDGRRYPSPRSTTPVSSLAEPPDARPSRSTRRSCVRGRCPFDTAATSSPAAPPSSSAARLEPQGPCAWRAKPRCEWEPGDFRS